MRSRWWRAAAAIAAGAVAAIPFFAGAQSVPIRDSVDSRTCATCHAKIYETYQRTGMARSFYRPQSDNVVEDYRTNNRYFHQASGTYFTMLERGGKYYQRRYQLGFQGKETNVDEKEIDYVMGSGNHVRTYLHRTGAGALLELPLAWYAEKGGYWAMNPGYDKPDQPDARRKISYECMFCHNAYPRIPAGSDQLRAEPLFPGASPEGIDCQRCHGPGRRHVEIARTAGASEQAIRSAIVNPARLDPDRQMEICMQCHLETTSFPFPHSILKYDRGQFSYRAGEPLADFLLAFDHAAAGPAEDRFQIVNSVYRLRMSECFLRSSGKLQCTTCHDPHDIPRGEQAARHYNGVCLECHTGAFRNLVAAGRHTAATACVDCHMPKRRTADVVHAVMTDHYIQRRKPESDLLAEMPEPHGPEIVYHGEVVPYYPKPLDSTGENELYLALAQVREENNVERGLAQFSAAIKKLRPSRAEFYVELADAWVKRSQAENAIPLYQEAVRRKPDSLAGWLGLGNAFEQVRHENDAVAAFRRATELYPADAAAWQKLGEVYVKQGQKAEAAAALEKSIELDGEVPEAHYALATLRAQPGGEPDRAEASFREAIRLQPDYAQARMNLAILLFRRNRADEAEYEFQAALRARPDYALGHFNYGLMLGVLHRVGQARSEFTAALRADPKYAEAHQELAKLAEAGGQADEAIREYSEAVRIRPELSQSQLALGAALARRGNLTEARPHLNLAARSSDPAIRESALRLLRELGQ
ncbi:MAG: tetratricopeptide repeat protein [Acidobacteriia bacterium]|nr:tetratricopeptide repeat protein [Terriglobia bacterium]